MTGDYHIVDRSISQNDKFGWFVGVGIQWGFIFGEELTVIDKFGVGARIPIGVTFTPIKHLDFIFDLAPNLGIYVSNSGIDFPNFGVGATVGFRYKIK